jgi:hypothetical protein
VKLELRVSPRLIGSSRSELFQSDDANSDRVHAVRLVELLEIVGIAKDQRSLQRGNGVRGSASDILSLVSGGDTQDLLLLGRDKRQNQL